MYRDISPFLMKRSLGLHEFSLSRLDFNENSNVGVLCRTNEYVAFIQKGLTKKVKKKVISALDVELVEISIADSNIVGSLLTINSNGAVATDLIDAADIKVIEDQGLDVFVMEDKINAAGNDILVNDNGAMVHPHLKEDTLKEIEDVLKVPVHRGTIGSIPNSSPIWNLYISQTCVGMLSVKLPPIFRSFLRIIQTNIVICIEIYLPFS